MNSKTGMSIIALTFFAALGPTRTNHLMPPPPTTWPTANWDQRVAVPDIAERVVLDSAAFALRTVT